VLPLLVSLSIPPFSTSPPLFHPPPFVFDFRSLGFALFRYSPHDFLHRDSSFGGLLSLSRTFSSELPGTRSPRVFFLFAGSHPPPPVAWTFMKFFGLTAFFLVHLRLYGCGFHYVAGFWTAWLGPELFRVPTLRRGWISRTGSAEFHSGWVKDPPVSQQRRIAKLSRDL